MKQSQSTNPFKFNFHDGDVGHSLVIAPTGMGMSVIPHLMRDGRKVNSLPVPGRKNEPYYRQYDKRK